MEVGPNDTRAPVDRQLLTIVLSLLWSGGCLHVVSDLQFGARVLLLVVQTAPTSMI